MLQDNWDIFGPTVLGEVLAFFRSGVMPANIARSNLILIPKRQDANQVGQFRPISVCNVLYKLISKIISLRLKPFIADCISPTQAAFVPGRDISENVILLREVLHSFSSSNYANIEFCLKVDLSKAFDRMDWGYLMSIMPLYGFPPRLVQWIMACVTSAQFSVVVNGSSDGGFFKPECGLRQGCTLSPYLFILGMDILSRQLKFLLDNGQLTGVGLAPSASPITNCIYADDLLLFGAATNQEAHTISQTLSLFSNISGQRVGPDKSTIWFSGAVSDEEKTAISSILSVPSENDTATSYLGAPISTSRGSFDFLIGKVTSKLQMWKGRILSQAGRLILIKSVLQSVPIYYMATLEIPTAVIKELTAYTRRFFWGALDKDRFLSYVAWDKISKPLDKGGLAIRDLSRVNDAMLMKSLFKLAAGSEALWTQIVAAKYMPRSHVWTKKRSSRCTMFWKAIMTLREKLLPWLTWRLGNGKKCRAFAQPWAPGMMKITTQNAMQRKLTVNELVEVSSNTWDIGRLIELFGFQQSVQIVTHVLPPIAPDEEDRLIFTAASHGSFSVKKAYIKLGELQATTQGGNPVSTQLEKENWRIIWRKGYVLPRLKLFLWKLVNRALPLGAVIAARTSRGDATCAFCGEDVEDANHMMFLCTFARSCWFAGPLPLQSDSFNGDLHYNLVQMARMLTDEQWTTMVNCMWSIWRCRNDRAYGGKIPSFQSFIAYFQKVNSETQIGQSGPKHSKLTRHAPNISQLPEVGINSYTCFTDGSWIMDWNGGMGFIISKGETLIAYRTAGILSSCPMQSEAKALLEAMKYVVLSGISSCRFCTDNLSLSKAISSIQPPIETEWRALEETMQIWKLMKENTGFVCSHVSRDENGKADKLAQMGSTKGIAWDCMGYTYPMFLGF